MRFARGQKSQHRRSFYPKKLRTFRRGAGDPAPNRRASILHSGDASSEHRVDLIADRFLVCDELTTIDLASGDRVELVLSACGGKSEQARWATRCEWLARLHHRSIARLLDFGPFGEGRRVEAWRVDGEWRGSSHERDRTRKRAEAFFRASGWSGQTFAGGTVRAVRGRAVVVPDTNAGFETDDGSRCSSRRGRARPISTLGLTEMHRDSLRTIAEIFSDRLNRRCRAVAICGPPGSGRDTVVMSLARAARLNGYVPVAAELIGPELHSILDGRSVAVLVRRDVLGGWRAFVQMSLVARRPQVGLFAVTNQVRGVHVVTLERLSVAALEGAVQPGALRDAFGKRIAAAARRARGLPGRFETLVWGRRDMQEQSAEGSRPSRVAESAVQYEQESSAGVPEERGGHLVEWPAPGELTMLRKRLQTAMALTGRGRHAAGDRTLRQIGASLARRRDWEHATDARLVLAGSLVKRGRPREALAVLVEARDTAICVARNELLNRIAVLTGHALVDDGRLDEAEAVLSAASMSANGLDEAVVYRSAALAMARCQFWQGRFDAAAQTLNAIDGGGLGEEEAVRLAVMNARVSVGQGDFGRAIDQASHALDRSRAIDRPDLIAMSACASAFAHLSVSDHKAVLNDVVSAVHMARRSHDPLIAMRARLLAAESHRRQLRRGPGLALVARIRRVKSSPLPVILRARVDLLGDLLTAEKDDDSVVRRREQASGLSGLVLFGPLWHGLSRQSAAVSDIVSILQCCQNADEESRVLEGLCSRLRDRLQASAVAFFVQEAGAFTPIVFDGVRIEPTLGPRVAALEQPIAPHYVTGRLEAGAPLRYGGRLLGVLLVRWAIGVACDSQDVVMLLATAAAAAGPSMAGMLARRSVSATRMSDLLGISAPIVEVRHAVERASAAPFAVLVEGESGTGKELVARALHRQGPRRERPFCTLNCAALPDDLVESELFGHSRGAFTGALAERPGVFEEAHTGTLFLDEIGELSMRAQAKVLRTIQEGELRRVGENLPRRIDVRLVAATNRDLRQEVAAGRFRLDLLYRLDVIRISLPPLRSRRDDIPLLAEHFWREASARIGSRATLSLATLGELARYDWPGNVRELQNVLAALAVRTPRRGVVSPSALPPHFAGVQLKQTSRLDDARKTFDTQFIRAALARAGGHRARAAQELGVTRQGLAKLMNRLGLQERSASEP
jgi:DNA-binding NtrC family response regulator